MTRPDSIDFSAIRVLDGGLATELERRGCDITGPLWSAHVLDRSPAALTAVHLDFLRAGADCIATASYQISAMGYRALGLSPRDAGAAAARALVQSVKIAEEARAQYASETPRRVWIAASLGPYGAALHNGAEYHGRYAIDDEALVAFHTERLGVLAETGAGLVAFETIPSLAEARAIVRALAPFPQLTAWISFTCRDAIHVAHGEPLQTCAEMLADVPRIAAIGINCTAPHLILPLLAAAQSGSQGRKPVIVYPNSGEVWDAATHCWHGDDNTLRFGSMARSWFAAGAQAVGGCCRTRPAHIAAVAEAARPVVPPARS
ncbi:MAG TPA: homocysteine S-methyltransferase [Acidobacteriaceae bacterium]|jgi:homocysteine S-methyltransferase|nr:homocysteine S-methyltransferase [Acidobacteriaceae bacterium]